MHAQTERQAELVDRLQLMESMMQEGRRVIEYWGWAQVLWGIAYLAAIVWSQTKFDPQWAWPVSMVAAAILTVIISKRKRRNRPITARTRALRSIWTAVGIALFLFCFCVGLSGHFEPHSYIAAVEVLLGVAYIAGAMILRWHTQLWVGIIWWSAAVATCFVPEAWILPILIAATLVGMIGFGLYLMYRERRDRMWSASHA